MPDDLDSLSTTFSADDLDSISTAFSPPPRTGFAPSPGRVPSGPPPESDDLDSISTLVIDAPAPQDDESWGFTLAKWRNLQRPETWQKRFESSWLTDVKAGLMSGSAGLVSGALGAAEFALKISPDPLKKIVTGLGLLLGGEAEPVTALRQEVGKFKGAMEQGAAMAESPLPGIVRGPIRGFISAAPQIMVLGGTGAAAAFSAEAYAGGLQAGEEKGLPEGETEAYALGQAAIMRFAGKVLGNLGLRAAGTATAKGIKAAVADALKGTAESTRVFFAMGLSSIINARLWGIQDEPITFRQVVTLGLESGISGAVWHTGFKALGKLDRLPDFIATGAATKWADRNPETAAEVVKSEGDTLPRSKFPKSLVEALTPEGKPPARLDAQQRKEVKALLKAYDAEKGAEMRRMYEEGRVEPGKAVERPPEAPTGLPEAKAAEIGPALEKPPPRPVAAIAEVPGKAVEPPAPPIVPPVGRGASQVLPRELSGAKPRYSYRDKQFELEFESDIDRAAYITAQEKRSKRDRDYLRFAMRATGLPVEKVRDYGLQIRLRIKEMARDADPAEGPLIIPRMAWKPTEVPLRAEKPPPGPIAAIPEPAGKAVEPRPAKAEAAAFTLSEEQAADLSKKLYKSARGADLRHDTAKEAAQEGAVAVLKGLKEGKYEPTGPIEGWAFQTGKNESITWAKKQKKMSVRERAAIERWAKETPSKRLKAEIIAEAREAVAAAEKAGEVPAEEAKAMAREAVAFGGPKVPGELESLPKAGGPVYAEQQIMEGIAKIAAITLKRGRLGIPDAGAVYRAHEVEARFGRGFEGDLALFSHEYGHHLKATEGVRPKSKTARLELAKLDYDTERANQTEGFGEYMRHLLTDEKAASLAPTFHAEFREILAAKPELQQKVQRIRDLISGYRAQTPFERVRGQIYEPGEIKRPAEETLKERLTEFMGKQWRSLLREWDWSASDIEAMDKGAVRLGPYKPKPGEGLAELALALTGLDRSLTNEAITGGVMSVTGTLRKLAPGIVEIVHRLNPGKISKEIYGEGIVYAYARQAIEAWGKVRDLKTGKVRDFAEGDTESMRINPGISLADAKRLEAELRTPERVAFAEGITEFNNAFVDIEVSVGNKTPEEGERIKAVYQSYMPLLREARGQAILKRWGGGFGLFDVRSTIRARLGSDLPITDPVMASMMRAARVYSMATKQLLVNQIYEVAKETKGFGEAISIVPPEMKPFRGTVEEVRRALKESGMEISKEEIEKAGLQGEDVLSFFRPDYQANPNKPIHTIIDAETGKKVMLEFSPEFYKGIQGLSIPQLPAFFTVLREATRLVKFGATEVSPTFTATNLPHDMHTYGFNTSQSLLNPKTWLNVPAMIFGRVWSDLKTAHGGKADDLVRLYRLTGGDLTTKTGYDMRKNQTTLSEVLKDPKRSMFYKIVEHPLDAMKQIGQIGESGPRLAEFKAVGERLGVTKDQLAQGQEPEWTDLYQMSNAAANVSVPFKRRGHTAGIIAQAVPYFSARIAGPSRFIRTIREHPMQSLLRGMALAAWTARYWWTHKDEDWYQKAEPWYKYGLWVFTDDKQEPVLTVPRGREVGWTISAGTEALLNAMYKQRPDDVTKWAKAAFAPAGADKPILSGETLLGLMPNVALVTPLLEAWANWSIHRAAPIEGRQLESLKPGKRATPYTTWLAKELGEQFNLSPAKLEYVMDQMTGGTFTGVVRPVEALAKGEKIPARSMPVLRRFIPYRDYSEAERQFYDAREKINQEIATLKQVEKQEPPADLQNRARRLNAYGEIASVLRSAANAQPDAARQLEKYAIGLYIKGLGEPPLPRYGNVFEATDLPKDVAEKRDDYLKSRLTAFSDAKPAAISPGQKKKGLKYLEVLRDWQEDVDAAKADLIATGLAWETLRRFYVTTNPGPEKIARFRGRSGLILRR